MPHREYERRVDELNAPNTRTDGKKSGRKIGRRPGGDRSTNPMMEMVWLRNRVAAVPVRAQGEPEEADPVIVCKV